MASPFDMRFSTRWTCTRSRLLIQAAVCDPHFGAGYLREALMLCDLCRTCLDTSSSNSWMRYESLDLKAVFRRALDVAGPRRLLFAPTPHSSPRLAGVDLQRAASALVEQGVCKETRRRYWAENLDRLLLRG